MGLGRAIGNFIINWRSTKTRRRIIVIESDDWGGVRTKDREALRELNRIHGGVLRDRFTQLDSLETDDDLAALYDVLDVVRDKFHKPAIMTANVSMANPDFGKIAASEFSTFFYEPFYHTMSRAEGGERTLRVFHEGIKRGLLRPQLHGREHVHALAWLDELRAGNAHLLEAFRCQTWGIPYKATVVQRRSNLQASLDRYGIPGEKDFQINWIKESAQLFVDYFGFSSTTFIPPAYTWHNDLVEAMASAGIRGIQGMKLQYQPTAGGYRRKLQYTGRRVGNGIACLARNVFFEPVSDPAKNWVDIVLAGIDRAFRNNQPAIIGSHRINFVGTLNPSNREANLKMLKEILVGAVQKYPDIEFMSSDELVTII